MSSQVCGSRCCTGGIGRRQVDQMNAAGVFLHLPDVRVPVDVRLHLLARLQHFQQPAHLTAHRELFPPNEMMPVPFRPRNENNPCPAKVVRRHIGQSRRRYWNSRTATGT